MKIKILLLLLMLFANSVFSQNLDINLLREINVNRNPAFDSFFVFVTNLAGPIAFATPLLFFIYSLIRKNTKIRNIAFYLATSAITSAIFSNVIKHSVNRARPFDVYPFLEKLSSGGSPSFPSGHTCDAFTFATALSIVYPKWFVIAPSYLWAIIIAYSRMHLGVHYPSDVLAAAIIGAGAAYLCFKGKVWVTKKPWEIH